MKVSVVVPVYKVEAFIERCATSLFEQTLQDVEYIFVDDASPDRSIEILEACIERYPQRKDNIRIIHHSENKGLPAARNTGLEVAQGEYVYHCDSDDFADSEMLQTLYEAAEKNNADMAWCDFWLSFEKNERYMAQPKYETPMDAVKAMLSGRMKFNVWNKLVRRTLYTENAISFPSGYGMGEDMTMIMLTSCASRVAYVPKAFYHYVKLNAGAFSQTYSERHLIDVRHNVDRIVEYFQSKYGEKLNSELAFLKLDVKFPFLIGDDWSKYRLWEEWYPEANRYITSNKSISLRSRAVQWLAWKGQFWAVWLYYKLVYKFIYGIIYK